MTEQFRLQRYERRTEWLLAAAALTFLALYSVLILVQPQGAGAVVLRTVMVALYLVFLADYLARLYLAEARGRWFLHHLLDLAIVVLPFMRPLRLLSLAVVLDVLQRVVGHTIRGRVATYTAGGVVTIVYAGALAVLDMERQSPDSPITNFGDALWWSVSTVTTVGYGDMAPVTFGGRLVAVALMIAGISLLGVVTATIASWIVQRVAEEDSVSQAVTAAHIEELREEIRRLRPATEGER